MKLSKYLKSQHISETEFAKTLGVLQATVNRYCRGKRVPGPKVMRKIFTVTHGAVSANDFFNLPAIKNTCCKATPKADA